MNVPAAIIATCVGGTFFAAASAFYYQPSLINTYTLDTILTANHTKARAAVSRLLINPASAEFGVLRSVKVDAAKYVCGNVNAKDKSGSYAGFRPFVYTVAIDFAHIDDDGRIAQKHAAFKTCPMSDEETLAEKKMLISSGALSIVKTLQKTIPAGDPSTLSAMASQMSPGGESSSGATRQQLLGQLAGQPAPAGQPASVGKSGSTGQSGSVGQQQANSTFQAALGNESEWRSDRPPTAWPVFPPDHPLARAAKDRTPAQALALAEDVERRWVQSKAGDTRARPSSEDITEALRALLAINPKREEFPKAWAAFARLRKIEHDAHA